MSRTRKALALGALALVVLAAVVVRDVQRIDPTRGGYDAPYDDFSGEPIDWSSHTPTDDGFRDDGGLLINTSLDCTTGQIRIHVGPFTQDYRTLSDRAIAIHEPHVACIARGFEPRWEHPPVEGDAAPVGESGAAVAG